MAYNVYYVAYMPENVLRMHVAVSAPQKNSGGQRVWLFGSALWLVDIIVIIRHKAS